MYRPYKIFETEPVAREVGVLAGSVKRRLELRLQNHVYSVLAQEPHVGPNIKRLKDWGPPTWRYRVGEWRLFYEIDERDRTVFMTGVEHRKDAYR